MTSASRHVAILGAGLIGLSSADDLLRRGCRVTLIESGGMPLRGASYANSGMIHPSQACSWLSAANPLHVDDAVECLARRSRDLLLKRMSELGLREMRSHAPGCYQVFDDVKDMDRVLDRMRRRGVQVSRVQPGVLAPNRPTLLYSDDRWGDAHQYGTALLASVLGRGACLLTRAGATLRPRSGENDVELFVNGQRFDADDIVVAAGVGSTQLIAPLSLALPIRPIRGWAVDFKRPMSPSFPDIPVMDATTRSALTPFADRIRLSGTLGEPTPDVMVQRWLKLMPGLSLESRDFNLVWSGLRPASDLGRPIIDETPVPNLWVNAGHGHMGWTLCAGSAEYLAQQMMGEKNAALFSYKVQA